MMKPRKLILLAMLVAATLGPGTAVAADEPATTTAVPTTSSDTSTDTAPLTLDQEQIDALQASQDSADDNQSVFEKASDFVTDNAPWFIIGIIVLAAIIAGILIMRGRPRKGSVKGPASGTPKASKSNKAMRKAGGLSPAEVAAASAPAQTPSPSELRRRKRAAIQRSREEERARRKAGIESRKAARRGEVPAVAAGATAVTAAGVAAAAGGVDPVEAEKQGARDQEVAAGAMARYGTVQAPTAAAEPALAPISGRAVPAPVSPSQTAPAAGVVTPGSVPAVEPEVFEAPASEPVVEPYEAPVAEPYVAPAAEPVSEYAPEPTPEYAPEPVAEPAPAAFAPDDTIYEQTPAAAEAETNIIHEPSLENPGADAAVGNAAGAFLAGGAAGAAGGLAAARSSQASGSAPEPVEPLEPVIAPEPGMAAEHALADTEPPVAPAARPPAPDAASLAAEERLRAKVAEIKATQEAPEPQLPVESPVQEIAPDPVPPHEGLAGTEVSPGLAAVERRLSENSEERDRAIRDAEDRLRRVEQRAEDAERRAAFAERLAQLKLEESEREKRLNDVVSGIDRAEQRAREAEARAAAAEKAAAAALEQSELSAPPAEEPPAPAPKPPAPAPEPTAPAPGPPLGEPYGLAPSAPEIAETPAPAAAFPEPVSAPAPISDEPRPPERKGLFGDAAPASGASSDMVNLNTATFEELREAGLSVTQATRILAYRERFGGYSSVEDLEKVPGFPADLIESLQGRLSI